MSVRQMTKGSANAVCAGRRRSTVLANDPREPGCARCLRLHPRGKLFRAHSQPACTFVDIYLWPASAALLSSRLFVAAASTVQSQAACVAQAYLSMYQVELHAFRSPTQCRAHARSRCSKRSILVRVRFDGSLPLAFTVPSSRWTMWLDALIV